MKTSLLLAALAGSLLLAGGAMAADSRMQLAATLSMGEKCSTLEKQFDEAIKTHGTMSKAGEAKTLRSEGSTLCAGNKQTEGVAKLEQALKDIGVTPKV
jgi:hypothetical protein